MEGRLEGFEDLGEEPDEKAGVELVGEGGVLGVGEVEGEFFVEGHPVEVAEGVDGGTDLELVVVGGVEVEALLDEGALGMEEEGGDVVGVVDEFDGLLLREFVHGEEFVEMFVEGKLRRSSLQIFAITC